jgi:hypothetical protein
VSKQGPGPGLVSGALMAAMPCVVSAKVGLASCELVVAMSCVLVVGVAFCDALRSTCSSNPATASTTWFPVVDLGAAAMVDGVSASVRACRVSAGFLGFDTFLVDAVKTADAALVLAYGEFVFLLARNITGLLRFFRPTNFCASDPLESWKRKEGSMRSIMPTSFG